jgi:hypothetical protein
MPSAFENLCGPGKPLHAEPPDAAEIAGLTRSGLARLFNCCRTGWACDRKCGAYDREEVNSLSVAHI